LDLDRRQFHRLVLGASTAALLGGACDRKFFHQISEIGRAAKGEGPNRIAIGRLTAAAGPSQGEVFAVAGYQKEYNNGVRGPGNAMFTAEFVTGVLQRPASIGTLGGPVLLAAPIASVWKAGPGTVTQVSLENTPRYTIATDLQGSRLYSYSVGDPITVFGRIETRAGGARGIYATADVIIGDVDEFVRRI
jgi:hypothetical protein